MKQITQKDSSNIEFKGFSLSSLITASMFAWGYDAPAWSRTSSPLHHPEYCFNARMIDGHAETFSSNIFRHGNIDGIPRTATDFTSLSKMRMPPLRIYKETSLEKGV